MENTTEPSSHETATDLPREDAPQKAIPVQQSTSGGLILWGFMLTWVVIAAGAIYAKPRLDHQFRLQQPAALPPALEEDIAELHRQNTQHHNYTARLAKELQALQQQADLLAAVQQQQAEDAQTPAPAQPSEPDPKLMEMLQTLRQRIATQEEQLALMQSSGSAYHALFTTLTTIRYNYLRGEPFTSDISLFKHSIASYPALQEPFHHLQETLAQDRVAMVQLRQEFRTVQDAIRASKTQQDITNAATLWEQIQATFAGLVRIEKTSDTPAPDSIEGLLRQASRWLQEGKLETTITLIKQMQPNPSPATVQWLEKAEARLDVEQAFTALYEAILEFRQDAALPASLPTPASGTSE